MVRTWSVGTRFGCGAAVLVMITLTVRAQSQDPFVGRWELNAAKSKFAGPAFKTSTMVIEAAGNLRKTAVASTLTNDVTVRFEFSAAYDGKEYPIVGLRSADKVLLTRTDASTFQRVHKKGSDIVATFVSRLSPDGNTLTMTQTGTNVDGKDVRTTMIYERSKARGR